MSTAFDLIICGAGPAGLASALAAAQSGWRVALVEKYHFPRHKVCGDCLNPAVWPVLRDLDVCETIEALEHAPLETIRFLNRRGRSVELALDPGAERAVTRESLDHALLGEALKRGVTLFAGHPLVSLGREGARWQAATAEHSLSGRVFIAADGRNSTASRLLGGPARRTRAGSRVALQCHIPLPSGWTCRVSMELTRFGYSGIAPVNRHLLNVCVVTVTGAVQEAKTWVRERFALPSDPDWHSLAPLDRPDQDPAPAPGFYLAGDAARTVEPFTGEGIFYALKSGQLAAAAAERWLRGAESPAQSRSNYRKQTRGLYRHRLWINRLSRLAVVHPWFGEFLLATAQPFPSLLQWLTTKVAGAAPAGDRTSHP